MTKIQLFLAVAAMTAPLLPTTASAGTTLTCSAQPQTGEQTRRYTLVAEVNHRKPLALVSPIGIYNQGQSKIAEIKRTQITKYKYRRGNLVIRAGSLSPKAKGSKEALWIAAKKDEGNIHKGTAILNGKVMSITCTFDRT